MGKGYINQAQKQAICGLVGLNLFVQDLVKEGKLPNYKEIKRNLKGITYNAEKVINGIMSVLDPDVQVGLLRFSKSNELICISRADPRGEEPMHLVTEDEKEGEHEKQDD